jgi:hypothetical protein
MQRTHGQAQYDYTGELQRREHGPRTHHRQPARRLSHRQLVRRRRANVLFFLVTTTVLTLFLAATTKSSAMVYAFALSFVSLCGYCYKLAQIRQYDQDRLYSDANWFHAA